MKKYKQCEYLTYKLLKGITPKSLTE